MPTPLRAQVILHTKDNLAENYVTNSWCISAASVPALSDLDDYTDCFKDAYDEFASYLAYPIAQNGHEIKWYDLSITSPPNYPLQINTWNLATNPSAAGLPSEVALCLSFQGEKVSGFPQNRRRGRVYIGPIKDSANSGGRPTSATLTDFANTATTLCSDLKAVGNPALLSVWSHLDGASVEVHDGWIDDAWDTQRRRGVARTTRTTWVAP